MSFSLEEEALEGLQARKKRKAYGSTSSGSSHEFAPKSCPECKAQWKKAEYTDHCVSCAGGALILQAEKSSQDGHITLWRRVPFHLGEEKAKEPFLQVFEHPAKGDPAFLEAIDKGDVECVRKCLKEDPTQMISIDEYGETPLHRSVYSPNSEIAKLLVELGADLHAQNIFTGATALHKACVSESKEMAEFLLSKGASPNSRMYNGQTPLHCSIIAKNRELISLLLTHGATLEFVALGKSIFQMLMENTDLTDLLEKW